MPVKILIHGINQQWYSFVEIPDIVWLINEIFVWLGGDQEAITCVDIEDNT